MAWPKGVYCVLASRGGVREYSCHLGMSKIDYINNDLAKMGGSCSLRYPVSSTVPWGMFIKGICHLVKLVNTIYFVE